MPHQFSFLERQMMDAMESKVIPLVQRSAPFVMLAPPPFVVSHGKKNITIRESAAPPLPAIHGKGDDVRMRRWFDNNLNAVNVPYWGCVLEGEADLAVGITEKMCEQYGITPKRWTIALPAGTLFWAPPGVPLSMGGDRGIHWERANPEKAYSRIFWMQITHTGASCHFCTSEKGKHWAHPHLFTPTRDIWLIAQRISAELKSTFKYQHEILKYLMETLLLYTLRGIDKQPEVSLPIDDIALSEGYLDHEEVIQRALAYIGEYYHRAKLTITDVAECVHLSPTHLGRLFRKHLHCTVKEAILNTRFERARVLLEDSAYNVGQIATFCGYCHSSSFIAAFEKRYQKSPLEYRLDHSK